MKHSLKRERRVEEILTRLVGLSVEDYYNPYQVFDWPQEISSEAYWMSPELLSVHGTPHYDALDEAQRVRLSHHESLNFHSANVHGIRDLLLGVVGKLYQPELLPYSEYLSHFVGEENEHMWFFAQLCLRYGGKIYRPRGLKFGAVPEPEASTFLTFAQILVFEDVGHFYNLRLARDERLPAIVRQVNQVHYDDEARHIAMGREVVALFYRRLEELLSPERLAEVQAYLARYVRHSLETFYNPEMYRDAGLPEPLRLRQELLAHPARRKFHDQLLKRLRRFFEGDLGFRPLFQDALGEA